MYAEVRESMDTFLVIEGDAVGMNLPFLPRFSWLLIVSYLRLEIRTVPVTGKMSAHKSLPVASINKNLTHNWKVYQTC